jgi:hypothetical protein
MRTMTLSPNSLNLIQMCPRKYDYERQRMLGPIHTAESLEKGTMIHKMMAKFYKGRMDGRASSELVAEVVAYARRYAIDLELPLETVEECIKQFRDYVMYNALDTWVPIAVEEPFSKLMYRRADVSCPMHQEWDEKCDACKRTEGLTILFEGKIDLIVKVTHNPGLILIVDHKTGSRNQEPTGLSNQFMGYAWAFQDIAPNKIPRVVINKIGFQKTLPPKDRFRRYIRSYQPDVLEEWRANTIYWAHQILNYIDNDAFPTNFTSCDKYGGCIFKDVCYSSPHARERKLKIDFKAREKHDIFAEEDD